MRIACVTAFVLLLVCLAGCVRRTISIESSPPGALVWLNDREVGRTPVEVDFLFYGDYDVRLEHPDAEPLMTSGPARAPLWDIPPFDFIAEILPVDLHSRIHWSFDLEPRRDEPEGILSRAKALRRQIAAD